MKLLLGNVESLFKALPPNHRVVYWDTVRRTSYTSGIPMTCYTIRVTGLINLQDLGTLAEVTIPCGSHSGEAHDEMDQNGKGKVRQYLQVRYEEIKALANHHAVELRTGILTDDPFVSSLWDRQRHRGGATMKSQMLLHCGGKPADLEDLRKVALPQETKSYKPLGHYPLVLTLGEVADKLLKDYEFDKGIYALSKDGQRMFGLHTYGTETSDLGLAIGFRNSYNKSMSIGIAIGASVMICDNLVLRGDITVLRKHTANVIEDLEMMILRVMYRAEENFGQISESADRMKQTELDDDGAFQMLGLLFGKNVLSPRQLPVAKKEWLSPSYSEFQRRNVWSFHNAVTTALKSTPPNRILERHIRLHDLVTENR